MLRCKPLKRIENKSAKVYLKTLGNIFYIFVNIIVHLISDSIPRIFITNKKKSNLITKTTETISMAMIIRKVRYIQRAEKKQKLAINWIQVRT